MEIKFCPLCAEKLCSRWVEGVDRLACPKDNCNYVFWNNPIPVVAGIVETERGVALAHNKLWPPNVYSMVTGFIECGESPENGLIREIREELSLKAQVTSFVGVYSYSRANQLILVYHAMATGNISLGEEVDDFRIVSREELKGWPFGHDKLTGWPFGAGWAIRDWLSSY